MTKATADGLGSCKTIRWKSVGRENEVSGMFSDSILPARRASKVHALYIPMYMAMQTVWW